MNSFYRGRVDPSEELVIGRKVRDVVKEASELGDKILILAQSVVDAQVTIHVCCFCRKVAAFLIPKEVSLICFFVLIFVQQKFCSECCSDRSTKTKITHQ